MKLPLSWLAEYVDVTGVSVAELESGLFYCGLEVEEIIHTAEKINKIVFCKILTVAKHPNADKLSVCTVDAGQYGILQIVTAATNVFEGAIVPVAVDGATLNNGETIKKGKLRGEVSMGMFCSGEELGINDTWYDGASVNGILIFREEYPLGEEVKKHLELEDYIFDISVTANRPDCQSIIGLAREIAAVLKRPFKMPSLEYAAEGGKTSDKVKVTVSAPDLCPRYTANYVADIKIGPSPLWLRRRLFRMGLNSINNIVDITNYVLLEIGQPMHAFDYRYLRGAEINVRRAKEGEKITTLDTKEFTLGPSNLVISDREGPVALAGIMGGLNSEIKLDTTEIVFEAAEFKRDNVRKTSRTLGQRSDSSAIFEKGTDAYSAETGMKRALSLVCQLGAGKIYAGMTDVNSEDMSPKTLEFTADQINGLLGITVPSSEMTAILQSLGFAVNESKGNFKVIVPPYREDVAGFPDIAEEVIREYGYDHINCTLFEHSANKGGGLTPSQNLDAAIKAHLVACGYYQTITYSFVSDKFFEPYGLDPASAVKLKNPLGEDFSLMRTSLVPSLVNVVLKNINKNNNDGKFFESSVIYIPKALPLDELPEERKTICLAAYGEGEDFFTVKGVIDEMFACVRCTGEVRYTPADVAYLHPGRSAFIDIDGKRVGYLGELNPVLGEKLGIDRRVYVAELDFVTIESFVNEKISFRPIAKYPSVERDLALLADAAITNAQITDCIKSSGVKNMESVRLFDVYNGEHLPKGKKSMAYRIRFTAHDRTLSVTDVEKYVEKILKELGDKLGITIR